MKKLLFVPLAIMLIAGCGNPHQLVIKSGDTTETLSEGKSAVPDVFKDYIYPSATTTGSVSADGENNEESRFLMLSCRQPVTAVSKWYQDKLKSSNWKTITVDEQPKLISLVGHKEGTEFNIRAAEDGDTTNISLSLEKQVEDTTNTDETNRENYVPDKAIPPTD